MKKLWLICIVVATIILAGFFIPLSSYTTTGGCLVEPIPHARLHLIKGDSLQEVKNRKEPPGAGCAAITKYTLYFL